MRHARVQEENGSEDSFLDVVANVVGVLIILVMLVGAQASRSLMLADAEQVVSEQQKDLQLTNYKPSQNAEELLNELAKAKKDAVASERDIQQMASRIARISHEAEAFDKQRVELAMHRSIMEEEIEKRKQHLDKETQEEFEVQRQLIASKLDLDSLVQEKFKLISTADTVTEIECVPTPLAKTVEGESIHLRLRNGLVSIVPLEELLSEVEYNLDSIRRRLHANGSVVETIGPLDGYRLKFTASKQRPASLVAGPLVGQSQRVAYSQYSEIRPTSEAIGQNVVQALMPNGLLMKHLQAKQRSRPAVVVWLYTDSFDEFRPLKKKVWEMGFPLATRLLKPGSHIAASPEGTRAAAQ